MLASTRLRHDTNCRRQTVLDVRDCRVWKGIRAKQRPYLWKRMLKAFDQLPAVVVLVDRQTIRCIAADAAGGFFRRVGQPRAKVLLPTMIRRAHQVIKEEWRDTRESRWIARAESRAMSPQRRVQTRLVIAWIVS
jgi:hypothetical protein